jgi:hypothetical protein
LAKHGRNTTVRERNAELYDGLLELEYPFHDRTITVTRCGRICMGPLKINLSQAFAGQRIGVKQVDTAKSCAATRSG